MGAIERAKQVTPPEMNSIIRVSLQRIDALGILARSGRGCERARHDSCCEAVIVAACV